MKPFFWSPLSWFLLPLVSPEAIKRQALLIAKTTQNATVDTGSSGQLSNHRLPRSPASNSSFAIGVNLGRVIAIPQNYGVFLQREAINDIKFCAPKSPSIESQHRLAQMKLLKAYKEREIPIPPKLAKKLKVWEAKADKTCTLVFPTAKFNPKLDFLDCLKAVAERARLDEANFWLHKSRIRITDG